MSDTPETDTQVKQDGWKMGVWVKSDFARKLERERDEARKERDEANEKLRILSYPAVIAVLGKMATSGHDEAMEAMRENLKVVDRISTERDELRAEVERLKADKARLDWLEKRESMEGFTRDAIDSAMKGAE